METKNQVSPPEDLAGYQNIVTGVIKENDILVAHGTRDKYWAFGGYIGSGVCTFGGFDVYRKMPCPKAGDHDKTWKDIADYYKGPELNGAPKFDPADWLEHEMKDGQNFYTPKVQEAKAKTNDEGKPPLAILPWKALREVALVQAYGQKKYGETYNWKQGMEVSRQLSCAMRHLADYLDGNDIDNESGRNHLGHAACRILFALENVIEKTAIDDRYSPKIK